MHLVQLLLPLEHAAGQPFAHSLFEQVRRELVDRFGGLTAFTRAPARGLWQPEPGSVERDDIVVYEVMTETLDRAWWSAYGRELEALFSQDAIVIRAHPVELL